MSFHSQAPSAHVESVQMQPHHEQKEDQTPTVKNLRLWTIKDVLQWLNREGLQDFVSIFANEEINGNCLIDIDESVLQIHCVQNYSQVTICQLNGLMGKLKQFRDIVKSI